MISGILIHFVVITMAIIFMATILNVDKRQVKTKKQWCGVGIIVVVYIASIIILIFWGEEFYRRMCPFTVQVPLLFSFLLICGKQIRKILFAFVTALVMISTPIFVVQLLSKYTGLNEGIKIIILILCGSIIYYVLHQRVVDFIHFVFDYENKMWWLYLCIPTVYWISVYGISKYNFTSVYTSRDTVTSFFLLLIIQLSYLLLFRLFYLLNTMYEINKEFESLVKQQKTTLQMIKQIREANEQVRIYRHDMRHHLSLINLYLMEGNLDTLKKYLGEAQGQIDEITPLRFCENETINLLLSSFFQKAQNIGIFLKIHVHISKELKVSDGAFCSILSNALENAMNATKEVQENEYKIIKLVITMIDEKLLIEVLNHYNEDILFENGIPISSKEGHGFGIKSIINIVKKNNGIFTFQTRLDKVFIMRIII